MRAGRVVGQGAPRPPRARPGPPGEEELRMVERALRAVGRFFGSPPSAGGPPPRSFLQGPGGGPVLGEGLPG